MRKAESSLATPGALALAIGRACFIFFGTTVVAHTLAAGTTDGRFRPHDAQGFTVDITGATLPSYQSWLGDALSIDGQLARLLVNTVWLGLLGMLFGVLFGLAIAGLLRVRGVRDLTGALQGPIMAVAVPGVLLFPLYRLADTRQLLPDGPSPIDRTALGSFGFLMFWAAAVGAALAPGFAGQFSAGQRHRTAGSEIAALSGASRPARFGTRNFGLQTAVLLLGLASAEHLSGHNGLFGHLTERLAAADLAGVLDVVFLVALFGAALALAVDLLRLTYGPPADHVEPDQPTRLSDTTWPLLAVLAVLLVVAAVGYLRDPVLAADQGQALRTPSIGGPWLGTDGAGASLVERLVIALGPTMAAAVIPAAVATLVGAAIHRLTRQAPAVVDHTVGAVVDVAWWPLPLLLPLAHLYAGNPLRSEFDLTVTLVTAAALVPLAARALRQSGMRGQDNPRSLLSVLVFLMAIAGSARVFLGFLGVTNGPNGPANADLGALVASTAAMAPTSALWSVAAPALTGAGLLTLLYWLAGAISTPTRHRELAPAVTEAATGLPEIDQALTPAEALTTNQAVSATEETTTIRVGPLGPEELRSVVRQQPEPVIPTSDQDITIGAGPVDDDAEPAVAGRFVAATDDTLGTDEPVEPGEPGGADEPDESGGADDEVIDLRDRPVDSPTVQRRPIVNLAAQRAAGPQTAAPTNDSEPRMSAGTDAAADEATAADSGGPDVQITGDGEGPDGEHTGGEHTDGERPDEEIDQQTQAELDMLNATSADLAADASKTIELRPSTLRRAGIVAPGATPPPTRSTNRSILAAREEQYADGPAKGPEEHDDKAGNPGPADAESGEGSLEGGPPTGDRSDG